MRLAPKTVRCRICFNDIIDMNIHQLLHSHIFICQKCQNQFRTLFEISNVANVKVLSIYEYNEFFRSVIYKLKACADVEIAPALLAFHNPVLKRKYCRHIVIPAPSHPAHDQSRGFNHVEAIFSGIAKQFVKAITKIEERKQTDLSAEQRKEIGKILRWNDDVDVSGKNVLLVDDVMTTGSTIRACVQMIAAHGAKSITVLVLSKVNVDG